MPLLTQFLLLQQQLKHIWLSLCHPVQTIAYSQLTSQLGISSVRELEDLIITECFYKGIISGKLDQQRRCLQASSSCLTLVLLYPWHDVVYEENMHR